jgi:CRISPR/Cas system-associated endonuclease Cas1
MGRTLYINHTNKPVVFRDGPSIWVKEKGKAGRRIPARLVGRVIIIGNVTLDSGTITLFTNKNIPITFMNNRSEESAVVIPYNHRLPDHYKEQMIFLDSDENIGRYEEWANAKRALLQLNLLRRYLPALAIKLEQRGFGEGNYQEILKGLRRVGEEQWLIANGVVSNIFKNMVIESVLRADLDPHIGVIHRRHNFGLALDICYIMGGEIDIQCLQFFRSANFDSLMFKDKGRWVVTNEGIKNIAHRFENKRKEMKEKVENIIDELFILMRELRA